ncbi:dipeptidase PepV [Mammaliicoccus sciuri]|uniref:dipeptidase PepV n=1 Tax=Mammaliicoccus sciuri TaxID=1296 RepID=UPI000A04CD6A|nr:dipeptidase PepV [Mammaliicoccus sciuri]ORI03611.1 dipeptidase PepV [Mammaliicoccus sciuri]
MWRNKIKEYEQDIINDLKGLLSIESVRNDAASTYDAPVGPGPKEALNYMYKLGERDGFSHVDIDSIAGRIEAGKGDDLLGILCHVDVVPAGAGWDSNPFEPVETEDAIIARGTLDDKGPTIAAYYAVKILEDMKVEWKKRIHIIVGTDEESDWKCTDRYFETEEMPSVGFAPDAEFPLIHGEKGIVTFNITQSGYVEDNDEPEVELKAFFSGERFNMVPDTAQAKLLIKEQMTNVVQKFESFLNEHEIEGETTIDEGFLNIVVHGKSAHGMDPTLGVNAGLYLIQFLNELNLDKYASSYVKFANEYLVDSPKGEKMGMKFATEEMGEVTTNTGIMSYTDVDGGQFGINLRYPEGFNFDQSMSRFSEEVKEKGFEIEMDKHQVPHYVDKNDPFIEKLLSAYRNQTGDQSEPFTIGGGTYARNLDKGVAFGAMFKESEDLMHQKNEYITKKQLFNATAIYLEAIYNVCVKGDDE